MNALFLINALLVGIIVRGWALSTLWLWFLVPIGAPVIGITTALGISVILGLFTAHLNQEASKDNKSKTLSELYGTIVAKSIGAPLVSVATGWLITLFM